MKNKFMYTLTISFCLLVIGIIFIILQIFFFEGSFRNIAYTYDSSIFKTQQTKELLKGQKVQIEFTSFDTDLGLVKIRFNAFSRFNTDDLFFQIREKGTRDFYYQNTYNTRQFTGLPYFPFGFPVIQDSKNKTYEISITSLKGIHGNAIALGTKNPLFSTEHQYPKSKITGGIKNLISFITKKTTSSFIYEYAWYFNAIYLLPFILYVSYISLKKRIQKIIFILFPLGVVLYDILATNHSNDFVFLILPCVLFFTFTQIAKVRSQAFFICCFFTLLICPIVLAFQQYEVVNRIATWAFLFLTLGTIERIRENN